MKSMIEEKFNQKFVFFVEHAGVIVANLEREKWFGSRTQGGLGINISENLSISVLTSSIKEHV